MPGSLNTWLVDNDSEPKGQGFKSSHNDFIVDSYQIKVWETIQGTLTEEEG